MGKSKKEFLSATTSHLVGRRALLAGGAGASAAVLLGSCSKSGPGASSGPAATKASLPDYVPSQVTPKPDLPGSPLVSPGYLKFPEPYNAYDGKPLKGETVTNFTIIYVPPIPPVNRNQWWQAINQASGGTLNSTMVPAGSWDTKSAATIASGSIPDIMEFTGATKSFPQLLDSLFVDLTPYLSGKNIRKYKNLASIPQICWKNSMVNGRIFGIPTQRPRCNNAFEYRADWLKAAGLSVPTNADEFTSMVKAVTAPSKGRWAITSGSTGGPYMYGFFFQMFKCPNSWSVDKSGNFTYFIESPGAEEALNMMQRFHKSGYFHPSPPESGNSNEKTYIQSGKIFMYQDGITGMNQNYLSGRSIDSKYDLQCMVAPAHDGTDPIYWNGSGLFGMFSALSKKSNVSVEARLRLCDWHASPFGSKQAMLLGYGVEGVDYTLQNGAPAPTKRGQSESAGTLIGYISGPPFVFSNAIADATKAQHAYGEATQKPGIDDPSLGLYSATASGAGDSLSQPLMDTISGITVGREPVSSWKQAVTQWKNKGGDKIRSEYEAAYQKVH